MRLTKWLFFNYKRMINLMMQKQHTHTHNKMNVFYPARITAYERKCE